MDAAPLNIAENVNDKRLSCSRCKLVTGRHIDPRAERCYNKTFEHKSQKGQDAESNDKADTGV